MRILVAIANHGTKNKAYVDRLIATYRSFSAHVDIVILSDAPKDFGPDIEVRVGAPAANPWSLPFAHRKIFVERQDDYDLFIYSEDDTEITEHHVDAFVDAVETLPEQYIPGFIRYELGPKGEKYYSTVHGPYFWDPGSIVTAGGKVFARYTNDHSACYILTRKQLKACIASGGYDVAPHEGRHDMLCSAATDPYINCGFTKLVCVSDIAAFSLHHLPDIYLGRIGIDAAEIDAQMARLVALAADPRPSGPLVAPRSTLPTTRYDKKYFEPLRREVLALTPRPPSRILSVGCDRGLTEGFLVTLGHEVVAIPLDPVIAVSAAMRGVRTTTADVDLALAELAGAPFDCLFFNNILSHVPDPSAFVARFLPLLAPDGTVVVSFDNAVSVTATRARVREHGLRALLNVRAGFEGSGYHPASASVVRSWLKGAGLMHRRTIDRVAERHRVWAIRTLGTTDRWLADTGAVSAKKPPLQRG